MIKDDEVQNALDEALVLHKEIHEMAKSGAAVATITEKHSQIDEKMTVVSDYFSHERDIVSISDLVSTSAAISEETAASCDMLNENADELKEAMGKFNLRKREPGKAYIPPEKKGDMAFESEAQRNYEKAVENGRVRQI